MKKLLFLHGFMGSPEDGDFLKLLPFEYHSLHIANSLEETIQRIKKVNPHVIYGYSMGGRLALQYLLKTKAKLDHLILESSSFGISGLKERTDRVKQDTALAQQIKDNFPQFLNNWYELPLWGQLNQKQKLELIEKRLKNNLDCEILSVQLETFSQGTLDAVSPDSLTSPLTYIAGSEDKKYAALAATLKCDKLIVQGAGHNVHAFHNGQIIYYLMKHIFNETGNE